MNEYQRRRAAEDMMGYTTTFKGVLKFTKDINISTLKKINELIEESWDCKSPRKWLGKDLSYVQFRITKDFSGIEWDGNEKFYAAELAAQYLMDQVRLTVDPTFGLVGELEAQGEEADDRWKLVCDGVNAKKVEWPRPGRMVRCADCNARFFLTDEEWEAAGKRK